MVGIVVVTHGNLARVLVETAESIAGKGEGVQWVCIEPGDTNEGIRHAISTALKGVDKGDGALILTDLFGGTPTNIGLSFLEEGRVDVLAGVNLPIMLKAIRYRSKGLVELAESLREYGQKGIVLVSEVMKRRLTIEE